MTGLDTRYQTDALGQQAYDKTTEVSGGGLLKSTDIGGGQSQQLYIPSGGASVLPGVSPTPTVSVGTDVLRNQVKDLQTTAQSGLANVETAGTSKPVDSIIEELRKGLDSTNTMTDQELQQIETAGLSTAGEYDKAIEAARETRRSTMARDIILAGERGGFENTQYAGTAAGMPTTGTGIGTFVGEGGILAETRSILDRNISYLQDAKRRAVAEAKAAEAKAIKTGKKNDWDATVQLVKLAEELQGNIESRTMQKETLAIQKRQAAVEESREKRQMSMDAIDQITKMTAIEGELKEGETKTVNIGGIDYVLTGTKKDEAFFKPEQIRQMMMEIPEGQTKVIKDPYIGDVTIQGMKSADADVEIYKVEKGSDVNIIKYNKTTGATTTTTVKNVADAPRSGGGGGGGSTASRREAEANFISDVVDLFEAPNIPYASGYVPLSEYTQKEKEFVAGGYGTASEFRSYFPPLTYLDKSSQEKIGAERWREKEDEEDGW